MLWSHHDKKSGLISHLHKFKGLGSLSLSFSRSDADSDQANLIGNSWQIFPNLSPFAGSKFVCLVSEEREHLRHPLFWSWQASQLTAAENVRHMHEYTLRHKVQSSAEQLRPAADDSSELLGKRAIGKQPPDLAWVCWMARLCCEGMKSPCDSSQ